MPRSLNVAATGMVAQQQLVDTISHNISNSNTTAYKQSTVNFQDLLYQTETRMGTQTGEGEARLPAGVQFGLGVKAGAITKHFQQGALTPTPGTPLNLAIDGRSMFMVELADGQSAYTRAGNLQLNNEGQIVDINGNVIAPGITIPDDAIDITISDHGQVSAKIPGQVEPEMLGTLTAANFINPTGLEAIGNNLYQETVASGEPLLGEFGDPGFGRVKQHFLESSNVEAIHEINNLIKAQRVYEMGSKVMQTSDQMQRSAVDAKA